ncbi:MAG TPA: DUF542 domain-containing protein [Bacillota bacterium]
MRKDQSIAAAPASCNATGVAAPTVDAATLAALTVNAIVDRWPQTMPVLRAHGIDMCCGGWMTLGRAAASAAVAETELIQAVLAAIQRGKSGAPATVEAGGGA